MYLNRQHAGHLALAAAKARVLESYLEMRVVEIAISSNSKDTPVILLWRQQSEWRPCLIFKNRFLHQIRINHYKLSKS